MRTKRWFHSDQGDVMPSWLLVNLEGEYEYRNPTSCYVHCWETFKTKERALDFLQRNIAPVERKSWQLYRAETLVEHSPGAVPVETEAA
jgi:hypothetical protein